MRCLIPVLLLIYTLPTMACSPEVITEDSVPEPLAEYAAALYRSSDYVVMAHVSRIETIPGLDANDVHFTVLSQIKGEFLEKGVVRLVTGGCPSETVELGEMRLMFLKRNEKGGIVSVHRNPKYASYPAADVLEALLTRE